MRELRVKFQRSKENSEQIGMANEMNIKQELSNPSSAEFNMNLPPRRSGDTQ